MLGTVDLTIQAESHGDVRRYTDDLSVLQIGFKLPLLNGSYRFLIETVAEAAEHSQIFRRAILCDLGINDCSALNSRQAGFLSVVGFGFNSSLDYPD